MPRSQSLTALTSVRFLAAAHVLAYHLMDPFLVGTPRGLINIVKSGFVAVSFFFVLSGFILAYVHTDLSDSPADRREFWKSRMARVGPNYFLALVLFAPVAGLLHATRAEVVRKLVGGAASGLLVQSWYPPIALNWNYPGWSLSVEAFFYALFPFLIGPLRRIRRTGVAMIAAWTLALIPATVYMAIDPSGSVPSSEETSITVLKFFPLFHLPLFAFGMLLGLSFRRGGHRAPGGVGPALSIIGFLGAASLLAVSDRVPYALLHNGLLVPLFGLSIYGLALGGGPIAWVLSRPAFVFLGEASYAVYILQVPIWKWVALANRLAPASLPNPGRRFNALVMLTVVAVSVLILKWFERPARRMVLKFLHAQRAASPAIDARDAERALK